MKRKEKTRNVGLARALSKLGYCSRVRAAELIRAGRVQLNGATRRDPETPVRLRRDQLTVDHIVVGAEAKLYLMLNKPRGLVTTAADEKGRDTVYSCLPHGLPWMAPVGRLDKASEGLLLLTNDSEWAARISDPATHLDKTYHVQVGAVVGEEIMAPMITGIGTADGEVLRAKQARVLRRGEHNSWLEVVLDEGKNRQIRRMLEELHVEVLRLVRVAVGPIILGELGKGACRALTGDEKRAMDRALGSLAAQRGRTTK